MSLNGTDLLGSMAQQMPPAPPAEGEDQSPAKRGRKANPGSLEKYQKIQAILMERPNEFSKKELCEKHEVSYSNFMQWLKKQQPKKEVKIRPDRIVAPLVVGQSIIVTTLDDLTNCLSMQLREAIREGILNGVKNDKIKVMR
jgi:hypothetical protein